MNSKISRALYEAQKDKKPISANIRLTRTGRFSSVKGTVQSLKVSRDGFPYAVIKVDNNTYQNVRLGNIICLRKNNKLYKV